MQKCPGFDRALMAVPESFPCPECGGDVEIWTDEKMGRCLVCKKKVSKDNISLYSKRIDKNITPSDKENVKIEILEYDDEFGQTVYYERYETVFALPEFDYDKKYKIMCEACPRYGTNLACPPYSPTFPEYSEKAILAKVICLRLPIEYFDNPIPEERYRLCFRKAKSLLENELIEYREKGYTIAGAGPCRVCEECVVGRGDTNCINPEKMIYSLESMGVNLIALTKDCFDIDLEWSNNEDLARFVCALGAVLFEDVDQL